MLGRAVFNWEDDEPEEQPTGLANGDAHRNSTDFFVFFSISENMQNWTVN